MGHRDRELGLAIIEALISEDPAPATTATVLDEVLADDLRRATRTLGVLASISAADPGETDMPLRRALADELDLARLRVRASTIAGRGSARLGPVMLELGAGGPRGALAVEALEVTLGPTATSQVAPLLHPDLDDAERLRQMAGIVLDGDLPGNLEGWLREIVSDAEARWDSTWLRACALHAAKARGLLDRLDLTAVRALDDPLIDEVLGIEASIEQGA
jgi:hypothetical protein